MRFPLQSNNIEQVRCRWTTKLPQTNVSEISKSSISNQQLNLIRVVCCQVRSAYTSQWSTINTYFPFNPKFINHKVQDWLAITFHIIRSTWTFCMSVASIVPSDNIYALLEIKTEPVIVWCIDHVMIKKGIWITTYYSGFWQILRIFTFMLVPIILKFLLRKNLLWGRRKHHRIYLMIFVCLRFNPKMSAVIISL